MWGGTWGGVYACVVMLRLVDSSCAHMHHHNTTCAHHSPTHSMPIVRALIRLLREGNSRGQEQAAWLLWELAYDPQGGGGGSGGNDPHIVSALARAEGLVVALAAGLAGMVRRGGDGGEGEGVYGRGIIVVRVAVVCVCMLSVHKDVCTSKCMRSVIPAVTNPIAPPTTHYPPPSLPSPPLPSHRYPPIATLPPQPSRHHHPPSLHSRQQSQLQGTHSRVDTRHGIPACQRP